MKVAKHISELGRPTRFGPNWPGKRCLARTRKGNPCQRPAFKHNGRCRLHGGLSTGAKTTDGVKRISEASLKHGRYTKDKLKAQRHAAKVGRRVLAKLRQLELKLDANELIVLDGMLSSDEKQLELYGKHLGASCKIYMQARN